MFVGTKNFYRVVYLVLFLILVIGFTFGYIYTTGKDADNNVQVGSYETVKTTNSGKYESQKSKNKKNSNSILTETKLIKKIHYTICGHTITKTDKVSENITQLNKNQFAKKYDTWNVQKYNSREIIISKKLNKKCPNHYIIKNKKGRVVVFYQTPVNGTIIKELTNISIANLSKLDQARLKKGIIVDSEKRLAKLLEDFGS